MPHANLREALRDQWVARTPEVQQAASKLAAATRALAQLEWKGDVATYVEERASLRSAVECAELRLDDVWEVAAAQYESALHAEQSDGVGV
jgi:hypothetical protein